jgi:hypothetical protein
MSAAPAGTLVAILADQDRLGKPAPPTGSGRTGRGRRCRGLATGKSQPTMTGRVLGVAIDERRVTGWRPAHQPWD